MTTLPPLPYPDHALRPTVDYLLASLVNTDHVLQNGDEVAFFPPMTGG